MAKIFKGVDKTNAHLYSSIIKVLRLLFDV